MSWTPERIEKLKDLWAKPLSATQIAAALGGLQHCRDGGRNAVIGKVRRLGLPFRGHSGNGSSRSRSRAQNYSSTKGLRGAVLRFNEANGIRLDRLPPERAKRVDPPRHLADGLPLPMPPPAEFDVPRIATADLEPHHCRFPCVADVREVGAFAPIFCGHEVVAGLPYCETHASRAFQPPQVRSRRPDLPAETSVVQMPKREPVAA